MYHLFLNLISQVNSTEKYLNELRKNIDVAKKAYDRDKRKKEAEERRQSEKEKRILQLIKVKYWSNEIQSSIYLTNHVIHKRQ